LVEGGCQLFFDALDFDCTGRAPGATPRGGGVRLFARTDDDTYPPRFAVEVVVRDVTVDLLVVRRRR
jgi:hypothetical protein